MKVDWIIMKYLYCLEFLLFLTLILVVSIMGSRACHLRFFMQNQSLLYSRYYHGHKKFIWKIFFCQSESKEFCCHYHHSSQYFR